MFKETKHAALGSASLPSASSLAPPSAAAPAPAPCPRNTGEFVAIGGPHAHLANNWPDHCPFPDNVLVTWATDIQSSTTPGAGPPKE